jgi:hypothetical protein
VSSNLFRNGRIGSKISNFLCAIAVTGIALSGSNASATNVLVNPGGETGDLTGWNQSIGGYMYAVSTNAFINGPASGHIISHSGAYVLQTFDTTADSAVLWQDFAAIQGSQWTASCYAICYASNYFNPGATAHMQVVFYDVNTNALPTPTTAGGVIGTSIMDPQAGSLPPGFYWIIAPPPATDASGWLYLSATNVYDNDPATEDSFETTLSSPLLTAPANTAFVRYRLSFDNATTDGGAIYWDDCLLDKVTMSDPDITNPPVSLTVYAGLPASFVVGASRAQKGEKLTFQWQKNGTNLPPGGGIYSINGATTNATLSFTNCQPIDQADYTVVVTDITTNLPPVTNSIRSVPVRLTVLSLSPIQKANVLGANAGFENLLVWQPWNIFNGCYPASTNNVYGASTTPVNIHNGNWAAAIGSNGDRDNGFWMTVPAAPGTVWKAGGYAYISTLNDFIAANTCRLQIWFKDSGGNNVPGTPTYESFKIYGLDYTNVDMQYTNIDTSSPNNGQVGYHAQLPRDQWVFLTVSNVVNNGGIGLGDDLPYTTLPAGVFTVPTNAGTAQINFQVYEYCPVASDNGGLGPIPPYLGSASDVVYWDDMQLIQVTPVTDLKASLSAGTVTLSFSAGAGLTYTVLYKTNLNDATWNVLPGDVAAPISWQTNTASVGTTYPVTKTDPVSASRRFYRVLVH